MSPWLAVLTLLPLALSSTQFGAGVEPAQSDLQPILLSDLGLVPEPVADPRTSDWLLREHAWPAGAYRSEAGDLVLTNGLVTRRLRVAGGCATVALDDHRDGAGLLRAVRPEARLVVDGVELAVGGLTGQPNHAYLAPTFERALEHDPRALVLSGAAVGPPGERVAWPRVRHHAPDAVWPPRGVQLRLDFQLGAIARAALAADGVGEAQLRALAGLRVAVHYELYDDVPVLSKWIEVRNVGATPVELDRLVVEELAVVESASPVETREGVPLPTPDRLHVESDYAMGGMTVANANRFAVRWKSDPDYSTQVNYLRRTPCLLEVAPERGPDVVLGPGESLESMRAFLLLQDSTDRERRGLSRRRMLRTVAPWVTENPLILHVVSTDEAVVRRAIDQAAACGFEMVSLSFGSGLDMEDDSAANHARFRALADYAAERGIHLGGYSLLSSRRVQPDSDNCVNPETGEPGGQTHGFCPALASRWGQDYFRKIRTFFEETGFLQFTHDGSYPGDYDAAARPPLQRGVDDSQWVQWNQIRRLYQWMLSQGVYLRIPDHYYLLGANECGMGYREVNWSLPRAQQVIHTRQNVFDGTWTKTPSMGWMFVPLTQYHGGGAAATIEPLDEHVDHYRRMLESNLGFGVQAVYRGHRLYDTERVRAMVSAVVEWFHEYRDVLESDVIHGRRADGRDVDWMLHVAPHLEERGLLVVHNPLDEDVTRDLVVPLYYTGLRGEASVSVGGAPAQPLALDDRRRLRLELDVPAGGMQWVVLRE